MSQNNDQGRPNPSQTWYDNGQVPQSKRFPFGAGNGDDASGPETRHNPQVDPYGQHNGGSQGNGQQNYAPPQQSQGRPAPQETPPYGQAPVNNGPQAPQYGNAPQRNDAQYGQYNAGQQGQYNGSQGQQPGYQQPSQQPNQGQYPPQGNQPQGGNYGPQDPNGQGNQPQYGSQGQQYGSQGQQYGNQPQYGGQEQQYRNDEPVSGDSGNQQFQGILDPHTGEIYPVPDLEGLQDTDALLVVVSGPDSGSQILLDTDVVTVGRSPNADIFLDDVTVSRKHAEFIRTPSGFTLRDTGSLNGTYVGRQLIDSIELQNGADVQIGKFRMIFQQRPRS
ncbi:FHA domain-containing protein [Brevibacterium aurantiacum]|uniref:FHA domain-containing protein n=1 Tax=Brevibacterium aurantiacum TaxID=273384 RepID=A0A2A3ZEK3_BREAU|nr:FHA domain-containing protein [Brevibacterium aurantiacum]PCC20306.1 FHA domain-containing protein [Brevibacterium aurantiacum]PCC49795.1 FHA domain-containing protein [Brevibacterium aurantiacum]TGD36614.1 FHA domain-containing protein [Brevibacterium aurantiacum]